MNLQARATMKQYRLIFNALRDPNRLSIIHLLTQNPHLSVSQLSEHFSISITSLQRHLNLLCKSGIIYGERQEKKKSILYSIDVTSKAPVMLNEFASLLKAGGYSMLL